MSGERGDDRPNLAAVGTAAHADQKAHAALQAFTRTVQGAQQQAPQIAEVERRDLAALHKVRALHVTENRALLMRAGWGAITGLALFGAWYLLFGRRG